MNTSAMVTTEARQDRRRCPQPPVEAPPTPQVLAPIPAEALAQARAKLGDASEADVRELAEAIAQADAEAAAWNGPRQFPDEVRVADIYAEAHARDGPTEASPGDTCAPSPSSHPSAQPSLFDLAPST